MFYDKFPSAIKSSLDKKIGASIRLEVVYDEGDKNILLNGRYSLLSISPIKTYHDPDIEYQDESKADEIELTFNDPDGYFNPSNPKSPFFNKSVILKDNAASGSAVLSVYDTNNLLFRSGTYLTISGFDYNALAFKNETILVRNYSVSGGVGTLTIKELTNYFENGSLIYSDAAENKIVSIRAYFDSSDNYIPFFTGRVIKDPETQNGIGKITVSNIRRMYLGSEITGADTSNKLYSYRNGTLQDSARWFKKTGTGTFDSSNVDVFDDCVLGLWKVRFTDASSYTIETPTGKEIETDLNTGLINLFTDSNIDDSGTSGMYIKGSYLLVIQRGKVLVYDFSDPKNISYVTNYSTGYVIFSSIVNGDDLYLGSFDFLGNAKIISIDITDPSTLSLQDTLSLSGRKAVYGLTINGTVLYVTADDYFYTINITDPTNLSQLGSLSLSGYVGSFLNQSAVGYYNNYCYVTGRSYGYLLSIDVSDSSNPTLSNAETKNGLLTLCTDTNGYLYTGYLDGTLKIYDLSTPTSPTLISTTGKTYAPYYMETIINLSYYNNMVVVSCSHSKTISLFNVTSKSNPVFIETIRSNMAPFYIDDNSLAVFAGSYILAHAENKPGIAIIKYNSDGITIDGKNIELQPTAFSGTFVTDDEVWFVTSKNMNGNVVQVLYDLIIEAGVDNKYIHCSSYFGDKNIGKLTKKHSSGATSIDVRVSVPTLIKTGESLTITEGSTTETVSVTAGNTELTQFPPTITLSVSALTHSYSSDAVVTWDQRVALDTDFNFDAAYSYCSTNGFEVKYSLDKDINYLQLLDIISKHIAGYVYQNNWGVDKIFYLDDYSSTDGEINETTNLKIPAPQIETLDHINNVTYKYGFSCNTQRFKHARTVPETTDENYGLKRFGLLKNKDLYLPGFWDSTLAETIAELYFKLWKNGLKIIRGNATLQLQGVEQGDIYSIVCSYPEIANDIMVIGYVIDLFDNFNVNVIGFICDDWGA